MISATVRRGLILARPILSLTTAGATIPKTATTIQRDCDETRSNLAMILVFDVNETLLDMAGLDPQFQRIFGEASVRREWFFTLEEIRLCRWLPGTRESASNGAQSSARAQLKYAGIGGRGRNDPVQGQARQVGVTHALAATKAFAKKPLIVPILNQRGGACEARKETWLRCARGRHTARPPQRVSAAREKFE